jgi:hypothetical protein
MLQKNLSKWSSNLNLWEVEWGISNNQATFWLQKQKSLKHTLIFTNWVATYDFYYTNVSKYSWEYYHRRLNENYLRWGWYRFVALWQRLKWKQKKKNILLYTDIFEDYPIVRHLSKLTNELYSVGWYPGLTSNRRKLLKFRYSYLIGKTEISVLPSIIILFSTFYPITQQFLKELGSLNIYYILFSSISDYRNMWSGSYAIFMTKNYVNYYYYYYLVYRVIHGDLLTEDSWRYAALHKKKWKEPKQTKNQKTMRWRVYMRFKVWKRQLKINWYRLKELKLQRKQKFWNQYLLWRLKRRKWQAIGSKGQHRINRFKKVKGVLSNVGKITRTTKKFRTKSYSTKTIK